MSSTVQNSIFDVVRDKKVANATQSFELFDIWQQFELVFYLANPSKAEFAISGFDGLIGNKAAPTQMRQGKLDVS